MGPLRIQNWSMGRLVREMEGRLVSPTIEVEPITGVSTDTRTIDEGALFVALRGERFDGHNFIPEAIDAGARAVVVDDRSAVETERIPGIVVDDCIAALGRLGKAVFNAARHDGMHSIAVTGSNGKTTTKEFLAALWGTQGSVWSTPGNLNNHIGVPLTLCAIPADCDHLIVEMGANHRGEIEELIELAPADQRIVTSIGRAHLGGFGSMSGVRKAKSEIFNNPMRITDAIVPFDERRALVGSEFRGNLWTFGTDGGADVSVESIDIVDEPSGEVAMDVTLQLWEATRTMRLPVVGRHNATNLAAALTTFAHRRSLVESYNFDEALAGVELPAGRFRIETIGPFKVMDDAYNANPSSMRASFQAFEQWCQNIDIGPRVAVIGDMLELGDTAEQSHRALAQWLADRPRLSAIAFVSDLAEEMVDAVSDSAIADVVALDDHDEAARWLADRGTACVFLKGSRGNRLEAVVDALKTKL